MSRRHYGTPLGPGWEPWPVTEIGYSFKAGDARADVGRARNLETGLIEWYALTWYRDDRHAAARTFHGQDLHDAFHAVTAWADGHEART